MKSLAIGVILFCVATLASASDPAEIVKKMIGYEYTFVYPITSSEDPLPGLGDCVDEGGGMVGDTADGFGASIIRCGKNRLLVLDRTVSQENGRLRNRILDAIVLPKYDRYGTSNNNKELLPNGMCTFDGDYKKDMRVLVRFGKRERITSKNGVLTAWGFDLEKGKIIKLDTSHIVCEQPDEP